MAKSDKKIEFTADFESVKKGEVRIFSMDISRMFVDELKVAKYHVEKEIKTKTKK